MAVLSCRRQVWLLSRVCIGRMWSLEGFSCWLPRQLVCAGFLLRVLPWNRLPHRLPVPLVTGWAKLSCRAGSYGLVREKLVSPLTERWFEASPSELLHVYYANV